MIKVKICGITKLEDALLSAELRAWAVGFIFFKGSPRYIGPDKAQEIIQALPRNIEKTGVFVNSSVEEIADIALKTGITKIQLHGDETREFCLELADKIDISVIKAFRVNDINDLSQLDNWKNIIYAALLDSYSEKIYGGTGKTFNWNIAKEAKSSGIPIILAGGLNSENIAEAYKTVQPYALDISSGVEKDKGIKDHDKLKELFYIVKAIE